MFFLMGLAQIKTGISYVWLSESVGFEYKSTAFTLINMFDGMTMAVVAIYFMWISHDWFWLCAFSTLLTYAATVVSLICPESPRWLLVNGRSKKAIASLNTIAQFNGREQIPLGAKFVEDPTNLEMTVNPQTGEMRHDISMDEDLNDEPRFFDQLEPITEIDE